MGLPDHMRIHENGIYHSLETSSTSCTPTMPNPTHTLLFIALANITSATTTISETDTDPADFSCLYCPRTFPQHIGLVGHLRIHHTETGEPVSGAPTYTRRIRLNCSHCVRTVSHRMGLIGHLRIHEDLL
ncbi:hypothetical protein SprV_0200905600 [Sparganum proliferum]